MSSVERQTRRSDTGAVNRKLGKLAGPKKKAVVERETPSRLGRAIRAGGRVKVDQIVEATLQLLDKHNSHDITVAMIAKYARISRTSIYAHFAGVDEIFKYVSRLYLDEIRPFVFEHVKKRRPQSLSEVVVYVIDAAVEFFDTRQGSDRNLALLLQVNATVLVNDYMDITVGLYDSLWKIDWRIEPGADEHPFRILTIVQTAIWEVSLRKYGRITQAYAQEAKHCALQYIQGVEQRFRATRKSSNGISLAERIDAAISVIGSAEQPQLLAICVEQLESLARLARTHS